MHEDTPLPSADLDRPLQQVIQEFGERVHPGSSDGEIDEWDLRDESFRRLVKWAEDEGCFFEGLKPLVEGGREHDLIYDTDSGSWFKFTKPSAAGYIVSIDSQVPELMPALPLEYLSRLDLQNEIFADDVTFVGIAGLKHDCRIVTRQSDIPGVSASNEDIIRLMTQELGFILLPPKFSVGYLESLAFLRDDVAVFDLRPANVVITESGIIVPIDSIPVRLDGASLKYLEGET
ncbi:hypothetical protein N9A86_02340 [Akkermansiaceae bacterium]|nr:hypothetical protein [Akkermansiaceae bacterium]MDB4537462.1 hypothetical protein [Akkermansiaceae bacterium]